MVFGILQKQQVLGASRVQIRRRDFERDALSIAQITKAHTEEAQEQESGGQPITNPLV